MKSLRQSNLHAPAVRAIIGSLMLAAASSSGYGQTVLNKVLVSSDIHAQLPASDGSVITGSDQTIFRFDPENLTAEVFDEPLADDAALDVDALNLDLLTELSATSVTTVDGDLARPGDVFVEGADFAFPFTGSNAGVPEDVSVDAVARDPGNGDLLLSFDRTFTLPGSLLARPADVFRFDGSGYSVAFDGSVVPESANLDAVHFLSNGNMLMSFDIDVVLPGSSGSIHATDDDIAEFDAATGDFTLVAFRLRDIDDSWQAADVDAIWADDINGGKVRFTESFRQVQEDVGTLVVTLERFEAAESPLAVEVTSIDGSASAGDGDFVEVNEVVSWDDGGLGEKQVSVTITDDASTEATTERFEVQVDIGTGFATLATPSTVAIEIIDNDGDRIFADGFES